MLQMLELQDKPAPPGWGRRGLRAESARPLREVHPAGTAGETLRSGCSQLSCLLCHGPAEAREVTRAGRIQTGTAPWPTRRTCRVPGSPCAV